MRHPTQPIPKLLQNAAPISGGRIRQRLLWERSPDRDNRRRTSKTPQKAIEATKAKHSRLRTAHLDNAIATNQLFLVPTVLRGNAYRSCLGNQCMGSHGGPWEPENPGAQCGTLHNRSQNFLKTPRQYPAVEFGKGCCGSDPQIAIIGDEQAKHPKKPSKPQRLSTVGCAPRTFASPLQPINFSSFPRSSVGMHTDLASATNVWVPTEDRGNQK